jgi:hypothetical protein
MSHCRFSLKILKIFTKRMKMTDRKKKSQKMRKRRFGQQAKTVEPIFTKNQKFEKEIREEQT